MIKSIIHNIFIIITLLLVALSFNFSVNAASKNNEIDKKQIAVSLIVKAKNALISGNSKLAQNYWQQAKSIDPSLSKPAWLDQKAIKAFSKKNDIYLTEEKFVELLKTMPYEKAKIELDKKLLFNPNNTKLRLVYLELAEKNKDEIEIKRHRELLGIKEQKSFNYANAFKYLLIVIVICLIIYELKTIFRTTNHTQQ